MRMPLSDCTETISWEHRLGDTAYGVKYADAVDLSAAVEWGYRQIVNQAGQEQTRSGVALVREQPASGDIGPGDRITHRERTFVVIDCQPVMDGTHLHHIEISLGAI